MKISRDKDGDVSVEVDEGGITIMKDEFDVFLEVINSLIVADGEVEIDVEVGSSELYLIK